MAITLYYMLESPPCNTVLLLLKKLKLEFKSVYLDLSKGEHLQEDFKKINPLCCVPTIVDEDFILWESRAICCYLINKYSKNDILYPTEPKIRATIDKWLFFDASTLSPCQTNYLFPILEQKSIDEKKKSKFYEKIKILDLELEKSSYFGSNTNYTLADLSIISTLLFALANDENFDNYPFLKKWIAKMKSTTEYQETSINAYNSFRKYLNEKKNEKI